MKGSRAVGAGLLILGLLPLHRMLGPDTGPAGAATRAATDAAWTVSSTGTFSVLALAALLAFLSPPDRVRSFFQWIGATLERVPERRFAVAVGVLASVLAAMVAWWIHGGVPTSVDEMVQLLHARAVLAGSATLPETDAGWAVQNGLFTESGWASIYPPLHTLLLAAGLAFRGAWLVGPAAIGVATWACASAFGQLFEEPRAARGAALLLAVTPFWLLLGATHLSHASAAAGVALVLWAALRAQDGGPVRWLVLGAAIGAAVAIRPWTGLALTVALLAAVRPWRAPTAGPASLLALLLGGAPFALLLLWWNAHVFGSAFTLGYTAAFGPAHGLGLHVDPWGNVYDVVAALAYTGADVVQLGAHLFESPLSPALLVGAALVVAGAPAGTGPLVAWVGGGLVAASLYWHHGIHMGPRMLFETVPAWAALTVACGVEVAGRANPPGAPAWRRHLRDGATWALLLALLGTAWLAPGAVTARRQSPSGLAASSLPVMTDRAAIVFVHGSWASRVAARLSTAGMRRDSIETVLRRNDICLADAYARAREAGSAAAGPEAPLDFDPLPGSPAHLEPRALSPGNVVRIDPSVPPTATCLREAGSDRLGALELEPVLWQAPPLARAEVVVVRDMGPAPNARVMRERGRTAYVYLDGPSGPRVLEYDVGMELLWGGPAR